MKCGGLVRESPPNALNAGLGIIVICLDNTFDKDLSWKKRVVHVDLWSNEPGMIIKNCDDMIFLNDLHGQFSRRSQFLWPFCHFLTVMGLDRSKFSIWFL